VISKTKRKLSAEKFIKVAEILKTIGHPIRLDILLILSENEPLCVSDILKNIDRDVEQSMLSHHLIKMKDKGILEAEKKGMHKMYRIAERKILNIFDCMEDCNF